MHAVAHKEQDTREDQRAADEVHIITEGREKVAKRHHDKKRQRAHDDEQDEPPRGRDGIRRRVVGKIADAGKKLHDHIADIVPVGDEHRNECSEVQQHIEEAGHVARALQIQQLLGDGEVAGGRNGQKLRHPLHKAEKNSSQIRHGHLSPSF